MDPEVVYKNGEYESNITEDFWLNYLNNSDITYCVTGKFNNRKVICINSNHFKLFENLDEAQNEGYSPASLEKIIQITDTLINKNKNDYYKNEFLSFKETLVAIQENKQQKTTKSVFHYYLGIAISPDKIRGSGGRNDLINANKLLDHIIKIKRSKSGNNGVFFVTSEAGNNKSSQFIVLKFVFNIYKIIISDKLLSKMGFLVPKSFYVSLDSGHYIEIYKKIKLWATKSITNEGNASKKTKILNVFREIIKKDAYSDLQISKRINATEFRELSWGEWQEVFSNKEILNQIGQMIILDLFLGNTDRLGPSTSTNAGNFMLYRSAEGTGAVALVDNELNFNQVQLMASEADIKDLTSKENVALCYYKLLEIARRRLTEAEIAVLREQKENIDHLFQGILEGATKLVSLFKSKSQIKKFLKKTKEKPYLEKNFYTIIMKKVALLTALLENFEKSNGEKHAF